MNRLTSTPFPETALLSFDATAGPGLTRGQGVRLYAPPAEEPPVASFVPMHYEANYAYPLIVWLHGCGQSERDLPQVMRHVSTRNYLAVAPRGIEPCPDVDPSEDHGAFSWSDSADAVEGAEERVFDAIEHASENLSVHPDRVFLAGVGRGGTMAMRLALAQPWRFAGVATFDGCLPAGRSPLNRIDALRSLPLLLAGSRHSMSYPERRLCQDLRLLHSAGATVSVRQYPGSDDLTSAMLADFDRWVMEIVCGATAQV